MGAFQIAPELRQRHGYPELTPAIKAKVFGLNALQAYRVAPEEVVRKADNDRIGRIRAAYREDPRPSFVTYGPRTPEDGEIRYRNRAEVHDMQRVIDTGTFDADEVRHQSLEFAYVNGPFSFQAEHIDTQVDSSSAMDPEFSAHYAQVAIM